MQVEITARQIELTPSLKVHVRRRLDYALGARYNQLQRVIVTLSDINGPRGGEDKRCQILVKIVGQRDIVVEDTQAQLSVAIDRAASRISRTVARKFGRQRAIQTQRNSIIEFINEDQAASQSVIGEN